MHQIFRGKLLCLKTKLIRETPNKHTICAHSLEIICLTNATPKVEYT